MNPALSPQTTGFLPSSAISALTSSSTCSSVTTVRTISTSCCTGAGLKKCTPMTRPGLELAVEISVTDRHEVLVARIASGADDRVELAEDRLLGLQRLDDGLDHEVGGGEVLERGRERDPAEQLGLLGLGHLLPLHRAAGRVLEVLPAAGQRVLVLLDPDDRVTVAGEHLGDAGTHGAQADHADRGEGAGLCGRGGGRGRHAAHARTRPAPWLWRSSLTSNLDRSRSGRSPHHDPSAVSIEADPLLVLAHPAVQRPRFDDLLEAQQSVEGRVPRHVGVGAQRDLGVPPTRRLSHGRTHQRGPDPAPEHRGTYGELLEMGDPLQLQDVREACHRLVGDQEEAGSGDPVDPGVGRQSSGPKSGTNAWSASPSIAVISSRSSRRAGRISVTIATVDSSPVRLVVARCQVDYAGRLTAHLPMATRVLMIKADGSVLVHSDGGSYKPLNWMSPPCTLREGTTEDGQVEWTVTDAKTDDTLRILIEEILQRLQPRPRRRPRPAEGRRREAPPGAARRPPRDALRRPDPGTPRVPDRDRPGRPDVPRRRRRLASRSRSSAAATSTASSSSPATSSCSTATRCSPPSAASSPPRRSSRRPACSPPTAASPARSSTTTPCAGSTTRATGSSD